MTAKQLCLFDYLHLQSWERHCRQDQHPPGSWPPELCCTSCADLARSESNSEIVFINVKLSIKYYCFACMAFFSLIAQLLNKCVMFVYRSNIHLTNYFLRSLLHDAVYSFNAISEYNLLTICLKISHFLNM